MQSPRVCVCFILNFVDFSWHKTKLFQQHGRSSGSSNFFFYSVTHNSGLEVVSVITLAHSKDGVNWFIPLSTEDNSNNAGRPTTARPSTGVLNPQPLRLPRFPLYLPPLPPSNPMRT